MRPDDLTPTSVLETDAPATATSVAIDTLTATSAPARPDDLTPTIVDATAAPATATLFAVDTLTATSAPARPDDLTPTTMDETAASATATGFALETLTATSAPARPDDLTPTIVDATAAPATTSPAPTTTATPPAETIGPTHALPIASDTPTALPAVLAYMIATPTAFGSAAQDVPPACRVRDDWAPYPVQSGDSLLALALAAGADIITIRDANCLSPGQWHSGRRYRLRARTARPAIDDSRTRLPASRYRVLDGRLCLARRANCESGAPAPVSAASSRSPVTQPSPQAAATKSP